jgi:flagellar basal body-associated protein FliL
VEPAPPPVAPEPVLPGYAPPPPPPSSQGKGKSNTGLIIAIVVVVVLLLCCCCIAVGAIFLTQTQMVMATGLKVLIQGINQGQNLVVNLIVMYLIVCLMMKPEKANNPAII